MEQRPHIFDPILKLHVTVYSQKGVTIYQNFKKSYLRVNSHVFDAKYSSNIRSFGLVKYMAFAINHFNQTKFEFVLDKYIEFTNTPIPEGQDRYLYMVEAVQLNWEVFTEWFKRNKRINVR